VDRRGRGCTLAEKGVSLAGVLRLELVAQLVERRHLQTPCRCDVAAASRLNQVEFVSQPLARFALWEPVRSGELETTVERNDIILIRPAVVSTLRVKA
jgi:hypothetical protein